MASTFEFLKHPVKLISSLLEAPPDIVIASKVTNTTPVVLNQVTAPEGICGWIPSEGSSSDWVCQAFGTVMPGIVFLVSVIIVALTLFFLVWYLVRCRAMVKELKIILKRLDSATGQSGLLLLQQSGIRFPPLSTFAQKIEDAQIKIASDNSMLSKSVSEIAENNNGVDAWTGKKLADEIPNWLTTLGLLTTFFAILLGLQHVKVLTNLEVQGIGGLVNGLSGKFFSSIVALSCALSVTVVNFFLTEKINLVWNKVIYKLESLLPHLRTENLLLDFIKNQKSKKIES